MIIGVTMKGARNRKARPPRALAAMNSQADAWRENTNQTMRNAAEVIRKTVK